MTRKILLHHVKKTFESVMLVFNNNWYSKTTHYAKHDQLVDIKQNHASRQQNKSQKYNRTCTTTENVLSYTRANIVMPYAL